MKDLTDIVVVLDRSGSMEERRTDAIGGFNALVLDQRREAGDAVLSLVQFDHEYEVCFTAKPLREVVLLTEATYLPRGSTALLDAIGKTITDTGARLRDLPETVRPSKVVLVIITDGYENASKTFSKTRVNAMVAHQRDVYKWIPLFIGTNQDAIAEAGSIGIAATHAIAYANSTIGTRASYDITSDKLRSIRRAATPEFAAVASSFTSEDRAKAMSGTEDINPPPPMPES